MNPELSIIIVNWNGVDFLPSCLKSIAENPPGVEHEVIVIDNASSDGSPQWLASDEAKDIFPAGCFRLIQSDSNLGFGRANNVAIDQTDSPFVFLLNPDTIVKPNAIDRLLRSLRSDDKVGAVAPRLLNVDGSLQPSVWTFPPTATKFLVEGLKLYHFLPKRIRGRWLLSAHWGHDARMEVQHVSGAALMVSRNMINEIGAFDPKFHMYGEDAEFCLRINRNHWKILFEPKAEIVHVGGQSAIQRWGDETRLKEEAAFLEFQKELLTPFQVMRNTSVRMGLLGLYYSKNIVLRTYKQKNFIESFRLQKRAFSDSWKKLTSSK